MIEHRGTIRDNATALLGSLPTSALATGLIAVLAGEHADGLKQAAAMELVALGRAAAAPILDALADREVRSWILHASGCPPQATDGQILRRIAGSPVAAES
jgi:hypothetical protein